MIAYFAFKFENHKNTDYSLKNVLQFPVICK